MKTYKQLQERINMAKAKMGDVIKDFQDSDAPQFKGKSAEKRRQMAIAAKLSNEEVEQTDEGYHVMRNGQSISYHQDKESADRRAAASNMRGGSNATVVKDDRGVKEELKGNQHKIDANKNGKVDGHDFKLLRGKKKVEEEVEELDELSKATLASYVGKAAKDFAKRKPKMGYDGQLKKMQNRSVGVGRALDKVYKEEVEQIDEVNANQIKKDLDSGMSHDAVIGKHANRLTTNTDAIRKVIKQHVWDKRMKKEEVEELDELSKKTVTSYLDKSEPRRKDYAHPQVIKRLKSAQTAKSKLGLPTGSNRGGYGRATVYQKPRVAATEETNHTED